MNTALWFWEFSDHDDGLGDDIISDEIWSAHFDKQYKRYTASKVKRNRPA